jgi:probable rRNA maturation factor
MPHPSMTETIVCDVACTDPEWNILGDLDVFVRRAVDAAWHTVRDACDDMTPPLMVCMLFSNDAQIQALNKQWRGFDKPTNVLSFPAAERAIPDQPLPLGDIILSFQTMQREALEENKTFEHHTLHLIIHGFLHLLGYDHEEEEEATAMEFAEIKALDTLGIANPYT